jgi:serine/threonine-protein kinase
VPIAISPDATVLAFTAGSQEGSQLYVRPRNRVEATALPGTLGAKNPFFSPDGRWIAFRSQGALKKVPASGGPVVKLTSLAERGSLGGHWFSDGYIYYAFGGSVWRVSQDGGSSTRLGVRDEGTGAEVPMWPQVLPGGRQMLLTMAQSTEGLSRIVVVPLAGGAPRTILEGAAYGRYIPSGHLVFVKSGSVLVVPFDVQRATVAGSPAPVFDKVGMAPSSASAVLVAAAGTIAFVEGAPMNRRSLVWVDRHGVASPLADIPARQVSSPAVSPDGERIAAIVTDRGQTDVWLYERATRAFAPLTFDGGIAQGLVWTPDGKHVTYAKNTVGRSLIALQAVGSDRRSTELLSGTNSFWTGAWSRDGRYFGFMRSSTSTNGDVEIIDMSGDRKPTPVVATVATEWGARLSPDGRWMAYTSNASGQWEVYVQGVAGRGSPRTVSVEGGTEVVWARDGREIFFRNGTKMMAAPVAVAGDDVMIGAPTQLFDVAYVMGQPGLPNYDVGADGRFLMVRPGSEEAGARPIHVVIDWLDGLPRLTGAVSGPSFD